MLDSWASVVFNILLDLRFPFPHGGLVDRHLNGLLVVGHHDGTERAEVCVELLVINRPETVEEQVLFIPDVTNERLFESIYSVGVPKRSELHKAESTFIVSHGLHQ